MTRQYVLPLFKAEHDQKYLQPEWTGVVQKSQHHWSLQKYNFAFRLWSDWFWCSWTTEAWIWNCLLYNPAIWLPSCVWIILCFLFHLLSRIGSVLQFILSSLFITSSFMEVSIKKSYSCSQTDNYSRDV